MCIHPKGRTQCIFPHSQHTCLYIYIDQKWIYIKLYSARSPFEHCSNHSVNFFCKCFFFKWPPVAILDVQKSLLTISDQYHNFYFCELFYKMAAGGHFGCPKLTFNGISGHFRSTQILFFKKILHFRLHFWPFQIDMQLQCFLKLLTKWLPSDIFNIRD